MDYFKKNGKILDLKKTSETTFERLVKLLIASFLT